MAFSEERKKQIRNTITEASEIIEYLGQEKDEEGKNLVPEHLNMWAGLFLSFLSAENLIQHSENLVNQSKHLTKLTITLGILAFAQILLFVAFR